MLEIIIKQLNRGYFVRVTDHKPAGQEVHEYAMLTNNELLAYLTKTIPYTPEASEEKTEDE